MRVSTFVIIPLTTAPCAAGQSVAAVLKIPGQTYLKESPGVIGLHGFELSFAGNPP